MITRDTYTPLLTSEHQSLVVDIGEESPPELGFWQNIVDMDFNPESIRQVSGLGSMPSMPSGGRFSTDEPILGSTKAFEAEPFGLAVAIHEDFLSDEQFDFVDEIVAELPRTGRDRIQTEGTSTLNNAFDTAFIGFTAGEALCQSHSLLDGTAIDNSTTADISVESLHVIREHGHTMRNERNRRAPLKFDWLVIPPQLVEDAREALGSAYTPGVASNSINTITPEGMQILVLNYLTSATRWFAIASKGVHRMSLRFAPNGRPKFTNWMDPSTQTYYAAMRLRVDSGFTLWRGVYGSNAA